MDKWYRKFYSLFKLPKKEEKIYSFDLFPKSLQKKIIQIIGLFFTAALGALLLAFRGDSVMVLLSLLLLIGGSLFSYRIYYLASRGYVAEITGVIIDIDYSGYRKQNKNLHIQDDQDRVYLVALPSKQLSSASYRISNIVTFCVYYKDICEQNYRDGEYVFGSVLAIERINATIPHDVS